LTNPECIFILAFVHKISIVKLQTAALSTFPAKNKEKARLM